MSRIHDALRKLQHEKHGISAETGAEPASIEDLFPLAATPETADESPNGSAKAARLLINEDLLSACAITKWKPNRKQSLFTGPQDGFRPGTEEFRTLRTRIQRMGAKRPLKVILVVSAAAQEGKTFVSANLAHAISTHGKRVLIIDADLRRPAQHRLWGAPCETGLSNFLTGEAELREIVQKGPFEGLYLIPSGPQHSNPSELISSGKLKALVTSMRELFDVIIIDSPPAGLVSDASAMADSADGVLFVVRAGSTSSKKVAAIRAEFREHRVLGVVLNFSVQEHPDTYYGYSPLSVEKPRASAMAAVGGKKEQ
jgi:capsular exopolysaccharide synthesis family protein